LSLCIFCTVFISLIVTVTPSTVALQLFIALKCVLSLAVSGFYTDVSVSDNLLVTISICHARTVSKDCCTRLCGW